MSRKLDAINVVPAYFLYYALAMVWMTPILWMIDTAFKPTPEIFAYPPRWIPSRLTLEHILTLITDWPFIRWMINSVVVSTTATFLTVVVSVLAGFSFARLKWKGRDFVFLIFLSSMFIPWEINAIPLYFTMRRSNLLNTYPAVFLPIVAMPIGTFLLRQFFINIPKALEDAATLDGCGSLRILLHIILPIAKPALGALAMYIFIFSWNEFFWSMIALQKADMFTLPRGLKALQGTFDINYGLLMAGSFLATLPTLILFLILQKRIIRGISFTVGKG